MSPEFPAAWVPTTASLEIASPPTVMSVQFAPSPPFALLKLSDAVAADALWGIANRSNEATRAPRINARNDSDRIVSSLEGRIVTGSSLAWCDPLTGRAATYSHKHDVEPRDRQQSCSMSRHRPGDPARDRWVGGSRARQGPARGSRRVWRGGYRGRRSLATRLNTAPSW